MRKKTALVLGVATACAALLLTLGGTYAYFSASAVSKPGQITAGNLSVEVDERDPSGASGFVGLLGAAPGGQWPASDSESYTLVITNTGSLSALIDSIDVVITSGRQPDLSEALEIRYSFAGGRHGPDWSQGSGWVDLVPGPILDLLPRRPAPIQPGESCALHFQLRWPNRASEYDNLFQGAETEFMFDVSLGQA